MLAYDQNGGGKGIRTPDPLLAKQMLYQLSYAPEREECTTVKDFVSRAKFPLSPKSSARKRWQAE